VEFVGDGSRDATAAGKLISSLDVDLPKEVLSLSRAARAGFKTRHPHAAARMERSWFGNGADEYVTSRSVPGAPARIKAVSADFRRGRTDLHFR